MSLECPTIRNNFYEDFDDLEDDDDDDDDDDDGDDDDMQVEYSSTI
jgi:hypothetical protein